MTEKEKRIIEKLKALIKDTPYEGEKKTALNVLKNYCLKHNIDEAELELEMTKKFEYVIHGSISSETTIDDYTIFSVIARHYFKRQGKDFYEMGFRYYEKTPNKLILFMELPPQDFVNLISEYEFYLKAYKKEHKKAFKNFERTFYRAFLMQQDLLFPADPDEEQKELTGEELEREIEVINQSSKIKKVQYFKQLS